MELRGIPFEATNWAEIAMLVDPAHLPVPVFDTATLHARAAAEYALG